MIGSLFTLFYAFIFFFNALTILNNQRFLRRIGLPLDPEATSKLSPTRSKIVDLLKIFRGLMIIPLIILNILAIIYEI
ncbi:hypothetical protein H311_04898, partial [Anncaliia algerae PRA109]